MTTLGYLDTALCPVWICGYLTGDGVCHVICAFCVVSAS